MVSTLNNVHFKECGFRSWSRIAIVATCLTSLDDIVSKTWKKDGKDRLRKKCSNTVCNFCSQAEFILPPVGVIVESNFLLNSHNHSTAPLIILIFDSTCVTVFCSHLYKIDLCLGLKNWTWVSSLAEKGTEGTDDSRYLQETSRGENHRASLWVLVWPVLGMKNTRRWYFYLENTHPFEAVGSKQGQDSAK